MSKGVIAIDNGGSSTCVITSKIFENFPSVKGLYGNRTLTDIYEKHDYIVEYKGEKYVMGTLAKYDCKYPLQMHSDTKQNIFFDLSVLVALHQFGYKENYLLVSVPISMHTDEEKYGVIDRLLGTHEIRVNEVMKRVTVADVKIAPETAVAFWVHEPEGKTRFIDLGSRTVGYATTIFEDGINRFIDTESGVFKGKGLEALDSEYNHQALSDYVCGKLLAIWDKDDTVFLLGGGANDRSLVASIRGYFNNVKILNSPTMANAIGMYRLGVYSYGMA